MNVTRRSFTPIWIITVLVVILLGYAIITFKNTPDYATTPGQATPVSNKIESPNPAYALAQATMDAGQSQLSDLSRRSTEVSLKMTQSANAAALSTQDANRRQKMELDYQATVVSLNITQAAATQSFISQKTQIAGEATTAAQNSAATATHSAYLMNVTQTVQAQVALDSLALQTAQAIETLTAYPRTATPFAVTQAALLMQKYDREQQSFINQIVTPLIPILVVVDLVLFILILIRAYRRFLPMTWSPRLRIARGNLDPRPLIMIDGVISDPDPRLQQVISTRLLPANPPKLPVDNPVHVEIINATDPPVANWIAEVEHQLADEGGFTR